MSVKEYHISKIKIKFRTYKNIIFNTIKIRRLLPNITRQLGSTLLISLKLEVRFHIPSFIVLTKLRSRL